MSPVDGQMMMPPGPQQSGTASIPLSVLIEYIIQRTYHDLTVLAELLPRKTDIHRKIEIVQFASRTRQLFVRLLALVKWANSASKVDKCSMISSFLDQQASLFVDTADQLAKMSRDTLMRARLPSFCLPSAIDVLTTGTYPRLPTCIKDKIVPPDPITTEEKRQTLTRLNQIIEYRLVTNDLPKHMHKPKISNGRVKFHVSHEFEVTLTLMEDGPAIPWRLLDIEILVIDPETGDGKALVHSLQVHYIHQLVQNRLMDNERPLHNLYNILHSFCQSLQLGVLHSQSHRLIRQRLGDHVRIGEYKLGHCLTLSYWRDPNKREGKPYAQTVYKLSIRVDDNDPSAPLQVSHFPQIQGSESIKVAQAIRSDHLSVEKLLMHTIQVRSLAKLKELEREIRMMVPGPCEIRDLPTVLYIPVIYPCMLSEMVCVTIDVMNGHYQVSMAEQESKLTVDIQECINSDRRDLRRLLTRVRLWLGMERCQRSVQYLQMTCTEQLPLLNTSGHPLEKLSQHRLYVRLPKQPDHYLIAEAFETSRQTVDFNYYLMQAVTSSFESEDVIDSGTSDPQQSYLRAGAMSQLDKFLLTHGACSMLQELEEEEPNHLARKRKLLLGEDYGPPMKKPKASPYFVPELTHILSLCEDRIPFVHLGDELQRRGLSHQGIQVDGNGAGLSLSLLDAPSVSNISSHTASIFKNDLLLCKFRMQKKPRLWTLEIQFSSCCIPTTNPKEKGPVHRVLFYYSAGINERIEKIVQLFLDDWIGLAQLYESVMNFANVYKASNLLQSEIEVRSYNYKRFILCYGPNKCYTASIQCNPSEQQPFRMSFGTHKAAVTPNPHALVLTQLLRDLNNTHNLSSMAQVLLDTWEPLSAITMLDTTPVPALQVKANVVTAIFTVLPQSPTHIRLVFRSHYCVEVFCRGNGTVGVRDGAYSMFDTREVVEGLSPAPGLRAFLSMFVDDSGSQNRRRSTTEDDHPPSPMETDSFLSQQSNIGSPANRQKQDGLRFPSPMTPPSNPHTPASPSSQRISQQYQTASPGNFPMSSPPSLHPGVARSPSGMMAPSPGHPMPSPSFLASHSPQSLGVHMHSPAPSFISPPVVAEGGSPYPSGSSSLMQTSPGTRNWPGSPATGSGRQMAAHSPGFPSHPPGGDSDQHQPQGSVMSPPMRMLPRRSWAASVSTLLSHEAFARLLSPSQLPVSGGGTQTAGQLTCPLHRFLSCGLLRRHMERVVNSDEQSLHKLSNEAGVMMFKTPALQFRMSLNPTTQQSLCMKATLLQDPSNQFESEDLQVLEKYFEQRVACPPYKVNSLTVFGKLISLPTRILKDLVHIMRLELMPEHTLKWSIQLCLTLPPCVPLSGTVPGSAAVAYTKGKFLFIVQLTWLGSTGSSGMEPQSVVVPLVYDVTNNQLAVVEKSVGPRAPQQTVSHMVQMLKSFNEFNTNRADCSIYPAIRELLSNLQV